MILKRRTHDSIKHLRSWVRDVEENHKDDGGGHCTWCVDVCQYDWCQADWPCEVSRGAAIAREVLGDEEVE